jgi:hypothetical protein
VGGKGEETNVPPLNAASSPCRSNGINKETVASVCSFLGPHQRLYYS